MQISEGKIISAQKVVVYGTEGIGKSTFASKFPNPLFSDTEGSTKRLNVRRLLRPSSWTMLLEQVRYVKANPKICDTYIIDTADWAEMLCVEHICATAQLAGIESFGWGKGYTYLAEEFGKLLNMLEELINFGITVVVTAHAQMRKFEQPDELGSYDRWEMKLGKKTAPLLKEWADMVLFANYQTYVVNVDGQGVQKGKNKAQGGKRIMHTTHHPCWDAKNRDDLSSELPFEFSAIEHCIPERIISSAPVSNVPTNPPSKQEKPAKVEQPAEIKQEIKKEEPVITSPAPQKEEPVQSKVEQKGIPKALADFMAMDNVTVEEIQWVVAVKGNGGKGYYPIDTPIENYDKDFVNGALVGMWPQVYEMIKVKRGNDQWDKLKADQGDKTEDKPY